MPKGNADDFSPAMFQPTSPIDVANLDGVPDEVKRTWAQFQDARSYDKNVKKNWPRYHSLYEGRHWDGSQKAWMSTPVVNLTFSVIQTIVKGFSFASSQCLPSICVLSMARLNAIVRI